MKNLIAALCAIVFGVVLVSGSPISSGGGTHLLGAKECTWGPAYWCSNITSAKNCGAVRHCIQTVWEKQTVTEDNDSICQICLDMVKQARDQLESNATQNDLKLVFEGSCLLIPLSPIKKECIKLVDNFIPELVETLASQMNPQVVCSVAGLCNNVAIDKMLAEKPVTTTNKPSIITIDKTTTVLPVTNNKQQLSCTGCNSVATIITNKFKSSNRDEILDNMLHLCGRLSSFSDGCSNIVITYFNDIYKQITESLSSESICHLSGVCSGKYHQHPEIVEIRPLSDVGRVMPAKDDIPCELCEQLVGHLRDLLVANTTESEFKQVLQGLCKQTKGFKSECLSIVDQYYDVIYKALVNNLDTNGACFLIGICPKGLGTLSSLAENQPIMPLLPALKPAKIHVTITEIPKKKLLGENEPKLTNEQINSMQLPIDRIMGAPHANQLIQNGEMCTICEYFLHFVQEALSTPANDDKIKDIVGTTCDKLPKSVRTECHNFVDMYGDAIIALLIQEIDPRQVCPGMKLCPQTKLAEDMEVFSPQPVDVSISTQSDSPTCPLCLFAVTQAQELIKNDKTKERVKQVLDNLCSHAPKKLQAECVDFIETYSSELIEMLITDFTPQQICVYIKLCTESPLGLSDVNISLDSDEEIMTNEIPDNTINGSPVYEIFSWGPECAICKEVINEALKHIINKKSKEHIKEALENACEKVHKIKNKCHAYIDKYGDKIIDFIMQELSAKEICSNLMLCSVNEFEDLDIDEAVKIDIIAIPSNGRGIVNLEKLVAYDDAYDSIDSQGCVLCEFVMEKLENEMKDKKTQEEIKTVIHNICTKLPKTVATNCNKFVDQYADLILTLVDTVPPKQICQRMQLCYALNIQADEIVECGVCHGAVVAIGPLIKKNPDIETQAIIDQACENLPAKYYEKCSDLIAYYGESIGNLIKSKTEESMICAIIGKCFPEEESMQSFLKIGGEHNLETARGRRSPQEDELVGSNKCSWGPSYWCESREHADECETHTWCLEKKSGYAAV